MILDLACMTMTSGGAGTLTLGVAASGALTFAQSGAVDGATITYAIQDPAGAPTQREVGRATWNAGPGTLTGRAVLRSTNNGSPINASTQALVFGTIAAEDIVPALRGYIDGLTLKNAFGGPTLLAVQPGMATVGTTMISNPALFQKSTSGWAAGTGNGGLDHGTIANSKWYWWFVIYNPTTNVIDFICSLASAGGPPSLAAPPAGYTSSRYIGSWPTDGSGNWANIIQTGDDYTWQPNIPLDVNVSNLGTTNTLYALSVPLGVKVKARVRAYAENSGVYVALAYSPDEGTPVANLPFPNINLANSGLGNLYSIQELNLITDTSGRIGAVSSAASTNFAVATVGWSDPRGRNS